MRIRMSVKEAAEKLGKSQRTVLRMADKGTAGVEGAGHVGKTPMVNVPEEMLKGYVVDVEKGDKVVEKRRQLDELRVELDYEKVERELRQLQGERPEVLLAERVALEEAKDKLKDEQGKLKKRWDALTGRESKLKKDRDAFERQKKQLPELDDLYHAVLRDMQKVKDYYNEARKQYPKLAELVAPELEMNQSWYEQVDDGRDGASDDIEQGSVDSDLYDDR